MDSAFIANKAWKIKKDQPLNTKKEMIYTKENLYVKFDHMFLLQHKLLK